MNVSWQRPQTRSLLCFGCPCCLLQCIDVSRQRLGVDSLDLLQFYWGDYGNRGYVKAAQHLAELQASVAMVI